MKNNNFMKEHSQISVSAKAMQDSQFMIEALAAGKLNYELQENNDNPLQDSLKLLQTNLQKLNWIIEGLPETSLASTNELKGDFSRSFKTMLTRFEDYKDTLEQDARTDALTGIPNRLAFMQTMDRLWKQGKKFFVTFIDLDNLKYRNDHYGHAEGDRYIRYACNFISLHGLQDDKLYRLGGDEFVLISFQGTLEELDQRLETIRNKFISTHQYNSDLIDSFSYGSVLMNSSESKTPSDLLGEADQKMYLYKAAVKAAAREAYKTSDYTDLGGIANGSMLFEALSHCASNQYIFVTNIATNITRWSSNAVHDLGLPSETFSDVPSIWFPLVHPDDLEAYVKDLNEVFTGKKRYHDITYRMKDATGYYINALCRGCMLYDTNNNPVIFAGVLNNLGYADNIDSITNLSNLYDFIENFDNQRKNGNGCTVYGVTFANFALINNTYGREEGDSILRQFADKLKVISKDSCKAYRLNGVDFALVFDKVTKAKLTVIHKQLCKIAKEELLVEGKSIDCKIYGAALKFNRLNFEATTIIAELADQLFKAQNTSNSTLIYNCDNQKDRITRNIEILDSVKRSAENDCRGFYMIYQPQVDTDGHVIGAEALLRWRSPLYGEIAAEEYINRLENSDCFNGLCMWALRTAMLDFQSMLSLNPKLLLSVNIAYCQINSRSFCRDILQIIRRMNFPAENLILELENRCYSLEHSILCQKIAILKEAGIKVVVDKFNTNDLNFSIIRDLPLYGLKIDSSFIITEQDQAANKVILKCLIECAKAFNIKICAKKIETPENNNFLKQLGIDSFQGFYYAKPMSLTKLHQFIDTQD